MAVDHIRYDILTQEALRGVVRAVLTDTAKKGLPGDHHFYISFDTSAEGVRLSPRMRAQYPEEMTVVLQHQFWDLAVSQDGFEVGISFGGIPERVAVPFAAIKGFFDPSVEFGLRFAPMDANGELTIEDSGGRPGAEHRHPPVGEAALPAAANHAPAGAQSAAEPAKAKPEPERASSGEVVRLDRFRKK
jgi:hypothetical protein